MRPGAQSSTVRGEAGDPDAVARAEVPGQEGAAEVDADAPRSPILGDSHLRDRGRPRGQAPQGQGGEVGQSGGGAAGQDRRSGALEGALGWAADGVDVSVDVMEHAAARQTGDHRRAEPGIEELPARHVAVLASRKPDHAAPPLGLGVHMRN